MPTSWYQAMPTILTQVKLLKPESILDVGVGFGKNGLLFRDILEIPWGRREKSDWLVKIDGVEACPSCHNPVYDFAYDKVYFGDILELIDTLPSYDCITLIGVIERLSREEGLQLITKLISHCKKGVIMSTPLYPERQAACPGNGLEQHKSIWSAVDFSQFNFTYERVLIEQNGAHIFCFHKTAAYQRMPFEEIAACPEKSRKALCIAYLLPHKNLTGGMKMLLQQMKHLKRRGHKIIACQKDAAESGSAIPDWFDLEVDEELVLAPNEPILSRLSGCDVIVAGWITQLVELRDSPIPVVYWEQGSEWLFGDVGDRIHSGTVEKILKFCYSTRHALLSVSPYVADTILSKYGRKTPILSNGIDTDFYCPGEKSGTNQILLVGNPHLPFKGFDLAWKALALAWSAGYRFHVQWVCQTRSDLPDLPFPISVAVKPTQQALVQYYQRADLHLFTSWYEGFGMPPLEAMACGTAVACTGCGGIDAFVRHGYNALVCQPGDVTSMATNIAALLKMPQLRGLLAKNGRATAESLDFSKVILGLEAYLYGIVP